MWSSRSSKSVMNVAIQYYPLATLLYHLSSLLQSILHQHLITCIPSFKTSWQTLMILSGNIWCYSVYKSLGIPFLRKQCKSRLHPTTSHVPMQPMALGSGSKIQSIQHYNGLCPASRWLLLPVPNISSSWPGLQRLGRAPYCEQGSVNRFVSLRNCCRAKKE